MEVLAASSSHLDVPASPLFVAASPLAGPASPLVVAAPLAVPASTCSTEANALAPTCYHRGRTLGGDQALCSRGP